MLREAIGGDRRLHHAAQFAQFVDAVGVVGVRMGPQHGVEPANVGVQNLLAQIGGRVDQNTDGAALPHPVMLHPVMLHPVMLHQDRGPEPPIPGVVRVTIAPALADHGNPA